MKEVELVVSHHNECLDWLPLIRRFVSKVYLYYKGDAPTIPDVLEHVTLIPLENVGRESHTYLTHMKKIKEQGTSSDVVVFTMASVMSDRHKWNTLLHVLHTVHGLPSSFQNYDTAGITYVYPSEESFSNFTLDTYKGVSQIPAVVRPLKKWFETYVKGVPFRPDKATFVGSIFFAEPSRIKEFSFYDELLRQVSVGDSIEVGHFIERVWKMIF